MNADRFAEIVEAYGAETRRWPEAERAEAEAFARANPQVAEPILARGRALDAVLTYDSAPAHVNDVLAARILAARKRAIANVFDWRPLAALAACAMLGVLLGFGAGGFAPRAEASAIAQTTPPVDGGVADSVADAGANPDEARAAEAAVAAAFHMIDVQDDNFSEQGG